jgi:predicted hydrolase (HD superfamily)
MGIEIELHSKRPATSKYRDTVVNEQVAEAALPHCRSLLELCESEQQVAAVTELTGMLRRCARTPGSHLWFIGD